MKLLQVALEKQDYNLAAHILVYGLIKALVDEPRKSSNTNTPQKRYGHKKRNQEKK